jgi:macrolide transport system ATP-binding/permease protein
VLELLLRLNDQGSTVVVITHEPDVAAIAHRVVRLADGQIVADEVPA